MSIYKGLTLEQAAHSEERLLAECLMHPNAGLSEERAVFVARSLQATGFQLTERAQRTHKVDRDTSKTNRGRQMKKKHLTSREDALVIARVPESPHPWKVQKLAESYLALQDLVKKQRHANRVEPTMKLLSQKRTRKIAADPKKVRGFTELARLAESYLVSIQVIEEQLATIEVLSEGTIT